MKLLSLIGRAHATPQATPQATPPARAAAPAADAAAQGPLEETATPPRGCGWYESSFELQQGLRVEEHLHADALASQLPLHAWLELQLSGWRGVAPGAPAGVFTPRH